MASTKLIWARRFALARGRRSFHNILKYQDYFGYCILVAIRFASAMTNQIAILYKRRSPSRTGSFAAS